jgi:DNA (cytosine-5)-methyltransferase 1
VKAGDLFAGPGGWDVAARLLGIAAVGLEIDESTCLTGRAAGHVRHKLDVAAVNPRETFPTGLDLLIASPPCQSFSMAGKGQGRAGRPVILDGVRAIGAGDDPALVCKSIEDRLGVPRAALVLEPLRWALELLPGTIVLEQVPTVLPVWEATAEVLRANGYHVWCGNLTAEQYDVPQTRRRAILIASRSRAVACPPPVRRRFRKGTAQHERHRLDPAGLLPWISVSDALDWSGSDLVGFPRKADRIDVVTIGGTDYRARDLRSTTEPSLTLTEKARSWTRFTALGDVRRWVYVNGNQAKAARRNTDDPAPTVHFGARINVVEWQDDHNGAVPVSIDEAAVLQGFAPDYPWQGSRTAQYRQVGDAIPPPLAWHVLREALGLDLAHYPGTQTDTDCPEQPPSARPTALCPCCGRAFDPATSYAGHKGSRRRYCSTACRAAARADLAKRRRQHHKRYAALMALHAMEAAGQLSLDPTPLPTVPELANAQQRTT